MDELIKLYNDIKQDLGGVTFEQFSGKLTKNPEVLAEFVNKARSKGYLSPDMTVESFRNTYLKKKELSSVGVQRHSEPLPQSGQPSKIKPVVPFNVNVQPSDATSAPIPITQRSVEIYGKPVLYDPKAYLTKPKLEKQTSSEKMHGINESIKEQQRQQYIQTKIANGESPADIDAEVSQMFPASTPELINRRPEPTIFLDKNGNPDAAYYGVISVPDSRNAFDPTQIFKDLPTFTNNPKSGQLQQLAVAGFYYNPKTSDAARNIFKSNYADILDGLSYLPANELSSIKTKIQKGEFTQEDQYNVINMAMTSRFNREVSDLGVLKDRSEKGDMDAYLAYQELLPKAIQTENRSKQTYKAHPELIKKKSDEVYQQVMFAMKTPGERLGIAVIDGLTSGVKGSIIEPALSVNRFLVNNIPLPEYIKTNINSSLNKVSNSFGSRSDFLRIGPQLDFNLFDDEKDGPSFQVEGAIKGITETVSTMYLLFGAGSKMVNALSGVNKTSNLGIFTTGYLSQYNNLWQSAKEATNDDTTATVYADVLTPILAIEEMIMPEGKLFNYASKEGLEFLVKGAIKDRNMLASVLRSRALDIFKENVEELSQDVTEKIGQQVLNSIIGYDAYTGDVLDPEGMANTILLTTLSTSLSQAIGGGFKNIKSNAKLRNEALYVMAKHRDKSADVLATMVKNGQISEQNAIDLINEIDNVANGLSKIPDDVPPVAAAQVATMVIEREQLNEVANDDSVSEPFREQAKKQADEIDSKIISQVDEAKHNSKILMYADSIVNTGEIPVNDEFYDKNKDQINKAVSDKLSNEPQGELKDIAGQIDDIVNGIDKGNIGTFIPVDNIYKSFKKLLVDNGYQVSNGGESENMAGQSAYLLVNRVDNPYNPIKVRISDHGVTNIDRMRDEVHLLNSTDPVVLGKDMLRAVKEIDFRLNPENFEKVNREEKVIQHLNVGGNEFHPETDEIISETISKRGKPTYSVKRTKVVNKYDIIDKRDGYILAKGLRVNSGTTKNESSDDVTEIQEPTKGEDGSVGRDAKMRLTTLDTNLGAFDVTDSRKVNKEDIQKEFSDAIVVQSEDELPDDIKQEIKSQNQSGRVRGVYHNENVYLVADNIKNIGEAISTYRHEKFGHHGVVDYLGARITDYAKTLVRNANKSQLVVLRNIASNYGISDDLSTLSEENTQLLGEEYIAYISENKSKFPKLWNDLVSFIRDALRGIGIDLSISDTEIQSLIGKVEILSAKNKNSIVDRRANRFLAHLSTRYPLFKGMRFNLSNDNDGALRLTETPQYKALKKQFGETITRSIRANMPAAWFDTDNLIPYLKNKIPIKSNMLYVLETMGGSLQEDFNKHIIGEVLEDSKIKGTPKELLEGAGYIFHKPLSNLSEADQFRHFYDSSNLICTYKDPLRPIENFVMFVVRNDAKETLRANRLTQDNLSPSWKDYLEKKGRKNDDGTYNLIGLGKEYEDPFGTSVLSIQINKKNGNLKIINRYNHEISGNPDRTFDNKLNKLVDGLEDAMYESVGVDKPKNLTDGFTYPKHIITDADGRIFKYSEEYNGVYYGDGFYIKNGVATILNPNTQRMVDGFIINANGEVNDVARKFGEYGFPYGTINNVNYIKGNEISVTTNNGTFVFETKNGCCTKNISSDSDFVINYLRNKNGATVLKNGNIVLDKIEKDINLGFFYNDKIIKVNGYADFRGSQLTSLGNLQSIGGGANFINSQLTSLGNLQSIGGDANFRYSQLTSLGNLQSIEGYADFINSQLTSLGNLQSIGGGADFGNSKLTSFGNLQSIGGDADFRGSQLTSLGDLQSIGGGADFRGSQLTSLGNLQHIGGYANFSDSQLTSLGNLQRIGRHANFRGSQLTSLGNLQSIGRYADFSNSQLTSLGNLQRIGGDADFSDSQLTSFGNLQSIGGNAYFRGSQLTSLGNLQSIGGDVDFDNSDILFDLGVLDKIKSNYDILNIFIEADKNFRDSLQSDEGKIFNDFLPDEYKLPESEIQLTTEKIKGKLAPIVDLTPSQELVDTAREVIGYEEKIENSQSSLSKRAAEEKLNELKEKMPLNYSTFVSTIKKLESIGKIKIECP